MKYFVYQGNPHDCGFTALKIYLAILAKDRSYLFIPKPSKREYYNLQDLTKVARSYGITLDGYTVTRDYFNNFEIPSITLLDDNHVVVVIKKTKKHVIYLDPGRGKVKLEHDEFLRRWRLLVLNTNHPEDIEKIKRIRQHLLPPSLDLLSGFVSLFSASLLIVAFYMLNKRENFWFSIIFLSLFIVGQVLEKMILYKQVYTFDKMYIPCYFDNKRNCTKESYIRFSDYKRQFFIHNRQMISAVLIAFTITFLLCFNDFRNIFVLLALILIKVLEIILLSRTEQDAKNYIAEKENSSFSDSTSATFNALEANKKADKHILYSSVKDLIYIFLTFVFAVLMMFITNNMGCNYVIFHFVMYYAGFVSYNQLLDNLSLRKETQKMERRFFDSCNL